MKMSLSHFLFVLAEKCIDMSHRNTVLFSIDVSPQNKSRIHLAYHFVRLHVDEDLWSMYMAEGQRLHSATIAKKRERFALGKELSSICDKLVQQSTDKFLKMLKGMDHFKKSTQNQQASLLGKATRTVMTLGLGSRLEKFGWSYK